MKQLYEYSVLPFRNSLEHYGRTCCSHGDAVGSILGERYISGERHPVDFRHLTGLLDIGRQGSMTGRSVGLTFSLHACTDVYIV